MSAAQATLPPPSTALRLLEARVLPEFGAFWLMRPWLSAVTPPGDGHPVLVIPGLLADDRSTYALRSFLNSHGYAAFGWELGRNFGMRANLERDMLARIDELFERCGQRRISLVGWSLGGPYARQLAKIVPDRVRCLISSWWAKLQDSSEWVQIPDERIIRERNPTPEQAHLCYLYGRVLCFVPPNTGT
jgi:pimeloyl-ACP methyl ester carboxylesterase